LSSCISCIAFLLLCNNFFIGPLLPKYKLLSGMPQRPPVQRASYTGLRRKETNDQELDTREGFRKNSNPVENDA